MLCTHCHYIICIYTYIQYAVVAKGKKIYKNKRPIIKKRKSGRRKDGQQQWAPAVSILTTYENSYLYLYIYMYHVRSQNPVFGGDWMFYGIKTWLSFLPASRHNRSKKEKKSWNDEHLMEGESERLIPSSYFLFQSFTSKTWWRSDHRRRCKPCIHYAMRVWDVKQKMLVNIKCGSLWMWNRKCWYVCVVKEGSKGSIEWKRMAIFPFAYVAYSNWTTCTSYCTAAVKLKKETWKMSHRACVCFFFFWFFFPTLSK